MTVSAARWWWDRKEDARKKYDALRATWDRLDPDSDDRMEVHLQMMKAWDAKYDAEKAFVETVCQFNKQAVAAIGNLQAGLDDISRAQRKLDGE